MNADARFWDDIAESYAAKPVEDPAAFERKISFTLERMRPDDVVLDVGCGTGSLALRFAPRAAKVHGLDLSPAMVRITRGKAAARRPKRGVPRGDPRGLRRRGPWRARPRLRGGAAPPRRGPEGHPGPDLRAPQAPGGSSCRRPPASATSGSPTSSSSR